MGFIIKKSQDVKPAKRKSVKVSVPESSFKNDKGVLTQKLENNKPEKVVKKKITNVMDTKDKLDMAESVISDEPKAIKRIKKDKGLIERTESSKTILTEDNKELILG